jgi:hypothetical protein
VKQAKWEEALDLLDESVLHAACTSSFFFANGSENVQQNTRKYDSTFLTGILI